MTPSPPPPGDQVREAAVEAVARELHRAWSGNDLPWDRPGGWQASWRASADRVLSLPAVSALLTEARADAVTGHPNGMSANEHLNRSAAQKLITRYCSCGRKVSSNIGWASHRRANPEHRAVSYSLWCEWERASGRNPAR